MRKCNKCGCNLIIGKNISKARYKRWKQCYQCERKRIVVRQKEKQQIVNAYKLGIGCSKCGYNKEACALDFHHLIPSEKNKAISRMIDDSYKLDSIFNEIKKCIILCANCHRIEHFKER